MARRRLAFTSVVCVVGLASCVSPEALRREDEATCAGFGFHPAPMPLLPASKRESLAQHALTSYPPPPYWGIGALWGRGRYWP